MTSDWDMTAATGVAPVWHHRAGGQLMQLVRLERLIRHAEWRLRRQRATVAWLRRQGEEPGQAARMLFCLELVLERLPQRVTGCAFTSSDQPDRS